HGSYYRWCRQPSPSARNQTWDRRGGAPYNHLSSTSPLAGDRSMSASCTRLVGFLGLAVLILADPASSAQDKVDVPALIQQLDDPDEVVRLLAARELGKRGADAKDAVSALTKALNDTDVDVRHVASQSLNVIQISLDKTKAEADHKKALADLQKKIDDAGKTK